MKNTAHPAEMPSGKLSSEPQPALKLVKISKRFRSGSGDVEVLREIDLEIPSGGRVCLLGASGSGKTTLIHICAGFEPPSSGTAFLFGEQIRQLAPPVRIGVVQQRDSLFPNMTVLQNAAFGALGGDGGVQALEVARTWVERVGLVAAAHKWPRELSGGMRRRAEVARALARDPMLLLLDEPFGSLDILTREEMQSLLLALWREHPLTTVFATHDIEEAIFLGHQVIVLGRSPGRIAAHYRIPFPDPRLPKLRLSSPFVQLRAEISDCVRKHAALS